VGPVDLAARFLPLLGTWTGLERLDPGSGHDATARASLVLRLDLGGTAVVQDYRQVRDDGLEQTAHGVFRASGPAEVTWWRFDSAGDRPALATGGFVDDALVLEGEGRRHRFRGAGDDLEQRVERWRAGAWEPVLSGRYRRLSGH
jgi:phosphate-selective porin